MTDISRVGLYGLTYKENVDDMRESPTLQMLESMERHLCGNLIRHCCWYAEIGRDRGREHLPELLRTAQQSGGVGT